MKIELTQQEIGLVQTALLELPAKISLELILKIDGQVREQGQEEEATETKNE